MLLVALIVCLIVHQRYAEDAYLLYTDSYTIGKPLTRLPKPAYHRKIPTPSIDAGHSGRHKGTPAVYPILSGVPTIQGTSPSLVP